MWCGNHHRCLFHNGIYWKKIIKKSNKNRRTWYYNRICLQQHPKGISKSCHYRQIYAAAKFLQSVLKPLFWCYTMACYQFKLHCNKKAQNWQSKPHVKVCTSSSMAQLQQIFLQYCYNKPTVKCILGSHFLTKKLLIFSCFGFETDLCTT